MTRERVCVAAWQYFLAFSDHPAAARHPLHRGELGMVLFIIAGAHCDRGDPVNNKVAHTRVHNLLDCRAAPRMTRECVWRGMIEIKKRAE